MTETIGPKSNITVEARDVFEALRNRDPNYALFSCFFDGEPTAVIASVDRVGDEYYVAPLFVALTEKMKDRLKDHDGRVPSELEAGNDS